MPKHFGLHATILDAVVSRGSAQSQHSHGYYRQYSLTRLGQPICLNEYATQIAEGPSTHVFLLEDTQADMIPQIDHHSQIQEHAQFDELKLETRPGRVRLTHVHTAHVDQLYHFFKGCREQQ